MNQKIFLLLTCFLYSFSAIAQEAYRGPILHFLEAPESHVEKSYEYFEDGILLVDQGKVVKVDAAENLLAHLPAEVIIQQYDKDSLIMPGFIDTHIHFPQTDIVACYGEQLLEWLNTYTFPHERRFQDKTYASKVAQIFIDELLKNGTTSALVFASSFKGSVDAFFEPRKHAICASSLEKI